MTKITPFRPFESETDLADQVRAIKHLQLPADAKDPIDIELIDRRALGVRFASVIVTLQARG